MKSGDNAVTFLLLSDNNATIIHPQRCSKSRNLSHW